MLVGLFSGMFIVPVQVMHAIAAAARRERAHDRHDESMQLGRHYRRRIVLGGLHKVLDATGWPRSTIFAVTALLMLPVALFYRPKDEQLPNSEPVPAA